MDVLELLHDETVGAEDLDVGDGGVQPRALRPSRQPYLLQVQRVHARDVQLRYAFVIKSLKFLKGYH